MANFGIYDLKSRRHIIYIRTPSIPSPAPYCKLDEHIFCEYLFGEIYIHFTAQQQRGLEVDSNECNCGLKKTGPIIIKRPLWNKDRLEVSIVWKQPSIRRSWQSVVKPGSSTPFDADRYKQYQQINTFILTWSQRVCIDSGGALGMLDVRQSQKITIQNKHRYLISGLQFNCHYAVTVRGMLKSGQEAVYWNSCFCTPSCGKLQTGNGGSAPHCPKEGEVFVCFHIDEHTKHILFKQFKVLFHNHATFVLRCCQQVETA